MHDLRGIRFILLVTALSLHHIVTGAHIIGGDMYYECLGFGKNGRDSTTRHYLMTLKLYRDCQAQNAANFDINLGFTIYREINGFQVLVPNGNSQEYVVPLQQPTRIVAPPNYPCLVLPPNVCVQEGIYYAEFELPITDDTYTIVWQRCCRNYSITNIFAPEFTGATFTIQINGPAQKLCNNSPRFFKFPPTVVCVNNPLIFDHSAVDQDGDLLIYEFCDPLHGGGRMQTTDPCDAIVPTPDCPPPFRKVNFLAPYTASTPMGGSPPVTIHSTSGLITGTPNVQGQFVVGVCVYEYRNGILLGITRRDFQFNVASCEGTLEPTLIESARVGPKQYKFLVCGNEFTIQNLSTERRFIKDVLWVLDNGLEKDSIWAWNPTFRFKKGGVHEGIFILNPGSDCSDTGRVTLHVVPDLQADYKAMFDSCTSGPVSFTDLSSSTYSTINQWIWRLGDRNVSLDQNPVYLYAKPGRYTTSLDVIDNYGCTSTKVKVLDWFPAPKVVVFRPNKSEGCVPMEVELRNISFPTDASYQLTWTFSDGAQYVGERVFHTFDSVGKYGVKLAVRSPLGCYSEGAFVDVFTVSHKPAAAMGIDKERVNIRNPVVRLSDLTLGTQGRTWIIDDKDYFFEKDLEYKFQETGMHKIVLIAADRFLCTDTLESSVYVYRDFSLFMPNAFTPNGDGKNEIFKPVGQTDNVRFEFFNLKIYDRWGGIVFESDHPDIGWNGKYFNSGADLPPGVYHYDLYYKVPNLSPHHEHKIVTLLR